MLVTINGKKSDVIPDSNIQDVIRTKNLEMTAIIIDLNGNIIAPEHWSDTFLHKDDDLEMIQIIGGG